MCKLEDHHKQILGLNVCLKHFLNMPSMQANIGVLVRFGEVMPRPKEGLLKRMLRIQKVGLVSTDDGAPPALLLHFGAAYHIALQVLQSPNKQISNMTYQINWVRITARGWEATELQVSMKLTNA